MYNAADSIVVGNFKGPDALAAVTSVGALINLLLTVFLGFSVGTAVSVAHDFGARDGQGVHRTIHTSILLALISGVAVGIFGFVFSGTFLQWMQSPENVIGQSETYLRIYFLGTPANMLYNFGAAVLRSLGETKKPLYYLAGAGALNVVLNLILVIPFGLGVVGVGVGTIVSQYVSALCVILNLVRRRDDAHLDFRKLRIYGEKLRKIVVVGIPAGLQGLAFSLSNVLIQSSINSFGEYAVAGNGAAASLEGFTYIAMNSVHHAALTFVGQSVGARRLDRVHRITVTCLVLVVIVGLVLGNLSFILGRPLISLYIDNNAEGFEESVSYGLIRMGIVCAFYFLCGIMDVLVGSQRGLGMSLTPMICTLIGTCLLRIVWIQTVFAATGTIESIYISYPISWIITATAHAVMYLIRVRKMKKLYAGPGIREDGGTPDASAASK